MFKTRLIAAVIALGSAGCAGQEPPPAPASVAPTVTARAADRGRLLAAGTCAGCHATGQAGFSPMAAAPPFREIAHRYPLDELETRFAEGLATTHPAMPPFVFRASEIDDLIAYLQTLKADR
ncbi:MAG: cytochrome c [Pseudomonadota bacterium]|nr:cytochrome c [Pseudomonadota bacterium]